MHRLYFQIHDAGWLVDVPRAAVPLLLEDRSLLLGLAGSLLKRYLVEYSSVNLISKQERIPETKKPGGYC